MVQYAMRLRKKLKKRETLRRAIVPSQDKAPRTATPVALVPLTDSSRHKKHGSETPMETMNDQFDEYRDCLRLVWNYALRHRAKGTISFSEVSEALLKALLLDDLQDASAQNTKRTGGALIPGLGFSEGYIPGVGIVISALSPIVYRAETNAKVITWEEIRVDDSAKAAPLYYVDVFDFRSVDAMLEFEYLKAVASKDFGHVRQGNLVVLRRSEVDVIDLTKHR
jgi:hypothetical protein